MKSHKKDKLSMDDKCFNILEEFLNSKSFSRVIFTSSNIITDSRPVAASKEMVSFRRKLANRVGRKVSHDKIWAFKGYNITIYDGDTNPRKYLAVLDLDQLVDIYAQAMVEQEYHKARDARLKICKLLKLYPGSFYPFRGFPSCGLPSVEYAKQLILAKVEGICPLGCGFFYEDKDKLQAHMDYVKEFDLDDTRRVKPKDLLDGVDV